MPETAAINDQKRIDALVNSALGRQLRPIAFVGLILCGIGYVMGHHVAMSHATAANRGLVRQLADLQQQIAELEDRAEQNETAHRSLTAAVEQQQQLREDETAAIHETLAEIIASASSPQWVQAEAADEDVEVEDDPQQLLSIEDESPRPIVPILHAGTIEPEQDEADTVPTLLISETITVEKPAASSAAAPAARRPDAPRRKGFLFFAPKRPAPLNPDQAAEPGPIPLPPADQVEE